MHIFKEIWLKWKKVAHKIGIFQSRILLTIFYFIVLTPFGVIFTFFKNNLKIRQILKTTWISYKQGSQTVNQLQHQY